MTIIVSVKRLLVCSEDDVPSVNMRSQLLSKREWEDVCKYGNDSYAINGDNILMTTSDLHIRIQDMDDRLEKAGIDADEVIFMSKHAAASGEAALTVHPIGNYHENKFGGNERTLVKANPKVMTDALRKIAAYNDQQDFRVCFEVTHHGPWLDKPTFFIEIGSDERHWGNIKAAETLAEVILDMETNDYPTAVGIAGGHYAPRFTEIALEYKINFGHMLPNYHLEGRDDEDIIRMMKDACVASDTNIVYVHRKSLKKSEERRIFELISSSGMEAISSLNLDKINEN